jgi:RimJ/RimL family protein N-acetyltransferase
MQVFLETPRLVLRRFTLADVDNLVSLNADPDVMRFISGGIPIGRVEIEDELLPAFLGYYERFDGYGFWAAVEKRTGEFLGCFYLTPQEGGAPGEAELGFRLRRSAWGKGYATEGSRALIRRGFTEFGVQCVVADTVAGNIASRRVLEKAGLRLVRTSQPSSPYPAEGGESGDVEYALRKADWEQQDQAVGHNPIGQS